MKKKSALFFIFFNCFYFLILNNYIFSKDYYDGEVIIKFKSSSVSKLSNTKDENIDNFFKDKNIFSYKKTFPKININKSNRLKKLRKSSIDEDLQNIYSVKISTDIDAKSFAKDLMGSNIVEWAEPRIKYKKTSVIPNDSSFLNQWYINPNSLKHINVTTAWDITTGSEDITIAVIDDGLEINHYDIKNNVWNNNKEIPGNGKDDDENGFVDDYNGWNFYDSNNNIIPIINESSNDPTDSDIHGTHVAGIISATGNNSKGICGITWKSKIMPLKVFYGDDCIGLEEAIIYAMQNGADIINMSLGSENYGYFLENVINNATKNGVICIAASGNDDKSKADYPARFSNCLGVSSTDQYDKKSDFSNYGTGVDISAPGEYILSLNAIGLDSYIYISGTSMACPVVSGVCALILSINPNLTFSEIKNILQETADDINNLNPKHKNKLGAGRINAGKAVKKALTLKLDYFQVKQMSNNKIYAKWNIIKSNFLDLSYNIKISTLTTLTNMSNPTFTTQNNSCIIPFELENKTTYYCYLEAVNEQYNIKNIYKSSPIYVEFTKEEGKKYNEDNRINEESKGIEIFIPKNTLNEDYYIQIELLNNLTNKIILANNKLDNNLKKGQNVFSRYYDIEIFPSLSSENNEQIEIKLKNFDKDIDGLVDETDIHTYNLKPYYLNENTSVWESIDNFVFDSKEASIKFYTNHLSIFGLFGKIEEKGFDIKDIIFYPNPFKTKEHKKCIFANFSEDINSLSINIYDISGKFLKHFDKKDLKKNSITGKYEIFWDGNSEKGYALASGVYFARIYINKDQKRTIKIAILG